MVQAIPEGYHTLTPSLTISKAAEAIEWYKSALDAEVKAVMTGDDGQVLHAEIRIGDSNVMLSDEFPEMNARSPKTIGGTPVRLWMYTDDVDAVFKRAVDAGAEVEMEPDDMFWGDRVGSISDPYGHRWSFAQHIEDVSQEELARRQAEVFG